MCDPATIAAFAGSMGASTVAAAGPTMAMAAGSTVLAGSTAATIGTVVSAGLSGLSVLSAGMSVIGAIQGASSQKKNAQYQAQINENNQILANRNAREIEKQGQTDANRYRSRVRQMLGDQTINLQSGGDVSVGSTVDLLADTAEFGELDAQTIGSNANRNAYNTRIQGMNYGNQANLLRSQAKQYSPAFAGFSSALSGVGTVASRWNYRKGKTA